MQTRSQRRFAIFFTLCEDKVKQRANMPRLLDWYDRIAMTKVLQCDTYRQVWQEVDRTI